MSPDNYSLLIALPLYLHSAFFLGLVFPAWLAAGQIHDAAFFGKLDTIQTLIDNGADIDERDSFDRTELHRAAGKDSPKVAEFLISKGSKLDTKDKLGWTPLFVSANAVHAITAEASDDAGKTPLFQAAFVGHYDLVKQLAESGADVHPRSKLQKEKALFTAIKFGRKTIAKLLIDHGADLHAKDNQDSTPPQEAAIRDSADIA